MASRNAHFESEPLKQLAKVREIPRRISFWIAQPLELPFVGAHPFRSWIECKISAIASLRGVAPRLPLP